MSAARSARLATSFNCAIVFGSCSPKITVFDMKGQLPAASCQLSAPS
jgi:hypothetical protein